MPFIEVFDFDASPEQRKTATRTLTDGICAAYGIASEIVSVYFFNLGVNDYGHGGAFGADATMRRIFLKVHAFGRSEGARRLAAEALTRAAMQAYSPPSPKHVVVYFMDRDPSQVAHAGKLESAHHN
jgi:phenylpyruvate tautomerase PptA (4-oxalocrotonate tautomerase family)